MICADCSEPIEANAEHITNADDTAYHVEHYPEPVEDVAEVEPEKKAKK